MKVTKVYLSALMCTLVMTGCSSDQPADVVPGAEAPIVESKAIELSATDLAVSAAEYDFQFNFVGRMAQLLKSDGNFSVSPVSAAMCLSMLANMADADMADAVTNLLGYDDLQALNSYNVKLLDYLPVNNNDATLSLVNALWTNSTYGIEVPDGAELASYGVEPQTLDFGSPNACDVINKWSEVKTYGLIPRIVGSLNNEQTLVLANSLYYGGHWYKEFDASKTAPADFASASGNVVVDMMHGKVIGCYGELDGAKVVNCDFSDNRTAMYLVLPPEGSDIYDFVAGLSASGFSKLCGSNNSERYIVNLSLPRFKTGSSLVLSKYLLDNGVDISKLSSVWMAPGHSGDGEIAHVTSIEIDEEGARMAATTATTYFTSPQVVNEAEFNANRPFAYYVIDTKTKAVLMAGVVANPVSL